MQVLISKSHRIAGMSPLNLAPTNSTTASLVLGDALAVTLLEARNFKEKDFAKSHPTGTLGRKLLFLLMSSCPSKMKYLKF